MEIIQVSEEDDEVDRESPGEVSKSVQYRGLTVRYVGKHLIEY